MTRICLVREEAYVGGTAVIVDTRRAISPSRRETNAVEAMREEEEERALSIPSDLSTALVGQSSLFIQTDLSAETPAGDELAF